MGLWNKRDQDYLKIFDNIVKNIKWQKGKTPKNFQDLLIYLKTKNFNNVNKYIYKPVISREWEQGIVLGQGSYGKITRQTFNGKINYQKVFRNSNKYDEYKFENYKNNLYEIILTIFFYIFNREYDFYFLPVYPKEIYDFEGIKFLYTNENKNELKFPIAYIERSKSFHEYFESLFIKNDEDEMILKSIFLQIASSILILNDHFSFFHRDFHTGNILLSFHGGKIKSRKYNLSNNREIVIPRYRCDVILIDHGSNCIKLNVSNEIQIDLNYDKKGGLYANCKDRKVNTDFLHFLLHTYKFYFFKYLKIFPILINIYDFYLNEIFASIIDLKNKNIIDEIDFPNYIINIDEFKRFIRSVDPGYFYEWLGLIAQYSPVNLLKPFKLENIIKKLNEKFYAKKSNFKVEIITKGIVLEEQPVPEPVPVPEPEPELKTNPVGTGIIPVTLGSPIQNKKNCRGYSYSGGYIKKKRKTRKTRKTKKTRKTRKNKKNKKNKKTFLEKSKTNLLKKG